MTRLQPAVVYLLTTLLSSLASATPTAAADCTQAARYLQQAQATADPRTGIRLLEQAADQCRRLAIEFSLGRAYIQAGDNARAERPLQRAYGLSNTPQQRSEALTLLAVAQYRQPDKRPETIATLNRVIQLLGNDAGPALREMRRQLDLDNSRHIIPAAAIARTLDQHKGFGSVPSIDLFIGFDTDQDHPNAQGRAQTRELGEVLQAYADSPYQIVLAGHTDRSIDCGYNQGLSERRADTVRRLIEADHPDLRGKLATVGYGEQRLRYPGNSRDDYRLNRRVVVSLEPKQNPLPTGPRTCVER